MMDWGEVAGAALAAAAKVVGAGWHRVAQQAEQQMQEWVQLGQYIELSGAEMNPLEYQSARYGQQQALQGMLAADTAISTVIAEQAVQAAWNVLAAALRTATGLAWVV